jgi:glycolate oxidase iron-sulfur subunit
MQHGQKLTRQPRALLRAAGFTVLDIPEKHFCCGSAGTYNLLQPDNAAALGQRKADHVASTDPDIVATGNIGCTTQIQAYSAFPVLHTVELLDWATGGPIPPKLANVELRMPVAPDPEPARMEPVSSVAPTDTDDGGFW